jgi:hypothetical protein
VERTTLIEREWSRVWTTEEGTSKSSRKVLRLEGMVHECVKMKMWTCLAENGTCSPGIFKDRYINPTLLSIQMGTYAACLFFLLLLVAPSPLVGGSIGVSVSGNIDPQVERGSKEVLAELKSFLAGSGGRAQMASILFPRS